MAPQVELIIGLIVATALVTMLSNRLGAPAPIMLVVAGILASFISPIPHIRLDPEVVLVLFLPPLVYAAALSIPWRDFRDNIRPIALLAVGCVIFTAVLVAYCAEALIPPLPLASAFVLGAAISPPDVVAATSIARRLQLPEKLVTILEGEGVVNDATALTIYRFAVAAAAVGSFSIKSALAAFGATVVGEIAWGLAVGWFFSWLIVRVNDSSIEVLFSLTIPYVAYLVPESMGGSGVLATVAAGMFSGRRAFVALGSETRLQAQPVWRTLQFALESVLFLLTGFQLRQVTAEIRMYSLSDLVLYGAIVSALVIVVRFAWVFPAMYLPRRLFRGKGSSTDEPSWRYSFLIAFTGMRGGVSLAAALAVPVSFGTEPFPARDLIIFLTFAVILATLVVQGLTLPFVIRWLGLDREGAAESTALQKEEFQVRIKILESALSRLEQQEDAASGSAIKAIHTEYQRRRDGLQSLLDEESHEDVVRELALRDRLAEAEQNALDHLSTDGSISVAVLRRVQRSLDLNRVRLGSNPPH